MHHNRTRTTRCVIIASSASLLANDFGISISARLPKRPSNAGGHVDEKIVICAKVCRAQTDVNAASSVSFADIENSMYKRRRLNQPALPTTVDGVDGIIAASRCVPFQ